jgi:hypothetical protein
MSIENTGKLIEAAGASAGGSLSINGTVVEENGTMGVESLGMLPNVPNPEPGVFGLINATANISGPIESDVLVGLMGSSHLGLQSDMMTFLAPIVLAGQQSTVDLHGISSFAGICIDPRTQMIDFVSNSNVVLTSMRVIDDVPRTGFTASYDQSTGTVTLGLFHH